MAQTIKISIITPDLSLPCNTNARTIAGRNPAWPQNAGGDRNCKYASSEYRLSKNWPHIARKSPSQVSDTYPWQRNQCGVEHDYQDTDNRIERSL
jgi:hypothetical protein